MIEYIIIWIISAIIVSELIFWKGFSRSSRINGPWAAKITSIGVGSYIGVVICAILPLFSQTDFSLVIKWFWENIIYFGIFGIVIIIFAMLTFINVWISKKVDKK